VVRAQRVDSDQEDASGRMQARNGSLFVLVAVMAAGERYKGEPDATWNQPTSET
jgi:hypothetical protein